jgi:nucleoside-diphosphate-sugar epimerase
MNVFVTGGNGFVGQHVVQALLERGDRVRVLALPGEDV